MGIEVTRRDISLGRQEHHEKRLDHPVEPHRRFSKCHRGGQRVGSGEIRVRHGEHHHARLRFVCSEVLRRVTIQLDEHRDDSDQHEQHAQQ